MADVSYNDYKAAASRLLDASKTGAQESPVDRSIFDQGDPIFGKQLDAETTAAAPAAAPAVGSQPPASTATGDTTTSAPAYGSREWATAQQTDPYSSRNTQGRFANQMAAQPFNFTNSALNAVIAQAERMGFAKPNSYRFSTDVGGQLNKAMNIPELPADASTTRQVAEGIAPLVVTALPAAGAAAMRSLAYAPRAIEASQAAWPAIRAGASSLFKNTVVAPVTATAGAAVGERFGGEPMKFLGGVAGSMLPSAVMSPTLLRMGQDYLLNPKYVDPRAPQIADALDRFGLPVSYGAMATDQGKALEAGVSPMQVASRNRAMGAGLEAAAGQLATQREALPTATPETAPYVNAAQNARTAAANQPPYSGPPPSASGAAQDLLRQNVGASTPVDVGNTINAINRTANAATPEVGDPLQARAGTLMRRVIPPPPDQVGPSRPMVPFAAAQGWRTSLGKQYENLPPVRGVPFGEVYPTITSDLRAGAAGAPNGGVPNAAFDTAMNISRNEAAANTVRDTIRSTLGRQTATGEKNFAQQVGDLSQPGMDYEYRQFSGAPRPGEPSSPNDISGALADLALASEKAYASPVQGGAREAAGHIVGHAVSPGTGMLGSLLAHGAGLPSAVVAAPVAASLIPAVRGTILTRAMQNPGVLDAMRGRTGRSPLVAPPSVTDLIAALNAAGISQTGARQ